MSIAGVSPLRMKGLFAMAKGVIVPQEKRNEIIAKIRDEGMTVAEAARHYDIGKKAIYSWMRDGVAHSSTSLILENNKLKKEIEQLYNLLGRATVELKKSKK
jgi:transposase-like protein